VQEINFKAFLPLTRFHRIKSGEKHPLPQGERVSKCNTLTSPLEGEVARLYASKDGRVRGKCLQRLAGDDKKRIMLFALPFPAIDPVLFEWGPVIIRWYALAYIAGVLFGWWLAHSFTKHAGLFRPLKPPSARDLDDFLVWAMLGIVLGGRLGFVLFYNLPFYAQNPGQVFQLWHGGMSFHGGLAGIILSTYLFARRRKLKFLTLMDIIAAVGPVGLFFGRIANFVNGELYGRASTVAWAVMFPRGGNVPRHPSQLYEAGLEGIVLLCVLMVAVWKFHSFKWPGFTGSLFLFGYGLARFTVEFFREPDAQLGFLYANATMGQLLSLPMIIIGGALMVYFKREGAQK
jgi:phosphatidylglycerol:prolipoprotein diacylglycerol transferase